MDLLNFYLATSPRQAYKLSIRYCLLAFLSVSLISPASAANCLYVSSYHSGYEWNDGIERGIEDVLSSKCKLDKFYMDTKRNPDKDFIRGAALKAKNYIEQTQPDVVIACDDNASKFLVKPYYRDAERPFVFCGINWTAEEYEYPYKNATGMIEVAPILPLLKIINNIIGSPRSGIYLSADVLTEHKDFLRYKKIYESEGVKLDGVFVKTLDDWKKEYVKAQKYDFIILNNNSGINDWDAEKAKEFAKNNVGVLTVTNYDWMMPYTMMAMTKLPEEQGSWAAQVALAILDGEKAIDIPVVVNRRWNIFINPSLLNKSSYELPAYVLQKAIVRED